MEEWDAQKMLDLYIHDYMIRKHMDQAAETFAEEANLNSDKGVVLNPPEGFLTEWWSFFWDVYSTKLENSSNVAQGSSSMGPEIMLQSVHLHMPIAEPSMNSMLPNIGPTVATPGPSNAITHVGDTTVVWPTSNNFLHGDAPMIRPMREMDVNRTRKSLASDLNFRQGESFTEFLAARTLEQERLKLPTREVSSSSQFFDVDQLARMLPAFGTSSNPLMNVNNNLLPPVRREDELGSGMRPMDAEPTDGENAILIMRQPTGSSTSSNSFSSDSSS